MRVICRHGHFSFYPQYPDELARFAVLIGRTLVRKDDYYTFEELAELEKYSINGTLNGSMVSTVTYEGQPWEVMKENNMVYSLEFGFIVSKTAILSMVKLTEVGSYWIANVPLIQPGSLNYLGLRIMSYDGELDLATSMLKIFEVSNE